MRIEKNPGLGFSISGGISGQGNPFKPSDKVRSEFLIDNFNYKKSFTAGNKKRLEKMLRFLLCFNKLANYKAN